MPKLEETTLPHRIWRQIWAILEEISDETGEENIDEEYLLKYEGWGGACVENIWLKVESVQKEMGMDIESEEAKEERERSCYEFAEEQSSNIINQEWIPELKSRGYKFITGGYDCGGLYGKTWAVFMQKSIQTYGDII